jgi:hypothetical protein
MLRGHRGIVAALIGFLIGALGLGSLLAWILWPGSPDLPSYGWQDTAYSDYQAGGTSCKPEEIRALPADRERLRKREACEDAAEQHRINTNDLIQQTRAADAAAAGVWVAVWQSRATVFGLIVGFYTLAAAAFAAFYAREAAAHTASSVIEAKRAADAAETALRDSMVANTAQLRAYLTIKRVYIKQGARNAIWVDIANTGQTPAFSVKIQSTDCRGQSQAEIMPLGMIGPQSVRHHAFPLKSAVASLCDYNPLAQFTIEYRDAFERRWEIAVPFMLNKDDTLSTGEWLLHICPGDWDEREIKP